METVGRRPRTLALIRPSWRQLRANIGGAVGGAAIWSVIFLAGVSVAGLAATPLGSTVYRLTGIDPLSTWASAVAGALIVLVALCYACVIPAALRIARRERLRLGEYFRPVRFMTVLGVMTVEGLISLVPPLLMEPGTAMDVADGVFAVAGSFLLLWTVPAVVVDRMGVWEAISASFRLSLHRPRVTVMPLIVTIMLFLIGLGAMVVGLLVCVPLATVFSINAYALVTDRADGVTA